MGAFGNEYIYLLSCFHFTAWDIVQNFSTFSQWGFFDGTNIVQSLSHWHFWTWPERAIPDNFDQIDQWPCQGLCLRPGPKTDLDHNDRIVFGSTHIWVFQNPKEKGINKKQYPPITFEYAQEEIAAKGTIINASR